MVKILLYSIFFLNLSITGNVPYTAIVIVPVADVVGKPLFLSHKSDKYKLPISGSDAHGCARMHQIIFNETVTVLEEREHEVRIALPNIFFEHTESTTRFNEYWTYKHAVLSYHFLEKQRILGSFFPHPISFEKIYPATQAVITLLLPHYDQFTEQIYSVGTRFVVKKVKNNMVSAYLYSPQHNNIVTTSIPSHKCLLREPQDRNKKISLFVALVQQWARQPIGFIPYVLGGCSFTTVCTSNHFFKNGNGYYRPTYQDIPATGLDCTGIISRAAQICGIPYYFKNTTTLVKYLRPIKQQESIENGDIIWFTGHAIIIADVAKNMCIESRSYNHGFGKIHAIPVQKLFAQMQCLDDIKQAMLQRRPLKRLDNLGNSVQTISEIKILKLSSVWQTQEKIQKS